MNLQRLLPQVAIGLLGFAAFLPCRADTVTKSGTFAADNDVLQYDFSSNSLQNYTFATTSYATGGFVPVLTLFSADGSVLDNFGSGKSDAMLTEVLNPGSYVLTLTESPNVAIGNLQDGFLFAADPTVTGDNCSVPGGKFYDSITCTQRNGNYDLAVTSVAATPEPASWLLVLPPAALMALYSRRRLSEQN